jgi:hypothetical protein
MDKQESQTYRNQLLQKAYAGAKLSTEENFWLRANPCYSNRFGLDYLRKDIISLEPNQKYLLQLSCQMQDPTVSIVPIISIPTGKGMLTLDKNFHHGLDKDSFRPRKKMALVVEPNQPAHILFKSSEGLLAVTYHCLVKAKNGVTSIWWESMEAESLAMKKEAIEDNAIQYGCCGAGGKPEDIHDEDFFRRYIFTIQHSLIQKI